MCMPACVCVCVRVYVNSYVYNVLQEPSNSWRSCHSHRWVQGSVFLGWGVFWTGLEGMPHADGWDQCGKATTGGSALQRASHFLQEVWHPQYPGLPTGTHSPGSCEDFPRLHSQQARGKGRLGFRGQGQLIRAKSTRAFNDPYQFLCLMLVRKVGAKTGLDCVCPWVKPIFYPFPLALGPGDMGKQGRWHSMKV